MVVLVVVPARCLQTQPSSVWRASDIALSKAVAQESHSRKVLFFRHSLRRSLSFECCRVPTGSPLTWGKQANRQTGKQANIMAYRLSQVCALIAYIFDRRVHLLSCECVRPYSGQSGDFLSPFQWRRGSSHTAACSTFRRTGRQSLSGLDCPVLALAV